MSSWAAFSSENGQKERSSYALRSRQKSHCTPEPATLLAPSSIRFPIAPDTRLVSPIVGIERINLECVSKAALSLLAG